MQHGVPKGLNRLFRNADWHYYPYKMFGFPLILDTWEHRMPWFPLEIRCGQVRSSGQYNMRVVIHECHLWEETLDCWSSALWSSPLLLGGWKHALIWVLYGQSQMQCWVSTENGCPGGWPRCAEDFKHCEVAIFFSFSCLSHSLPGHGMEIGIENI